MRIKKQIFDDGREYTRTEIVNILRATGRKGVRMYYNVLGWSCFYTTQPTAATPTGAATGFPSTRYITRDE